jgi:hypothetical protein
MARLDEEEARRSQLRGRGGEQQAAEGERGEGRDAIWFG